MLNIKEKVMRFLEAFYVFEKVVTVMYFAEDYEYYDLHCKDLTTEVNSIKWLLDYQNRKLEEATNELIDVLALAMIEGKKNQMKEFGFVLEDYNKDEASESIEETKKLLFFVLKCYGAKAEEIIKYDEEDAYDKFMQWFLEKVSEK